MKTTKPVRPRLSPDRSAEVRRIVKAAKANGIYTSEAAVAEMAVGIGLPEVRRKLTGQG